MKMTPEHYQHLRELMLPMKEQIVNHRAWLLRSTKPMDLEKRLRWDIFREAGGLEHFCTICSGGLYSYLNDNHIDTALKAVMKEIDK